MDVDSKNKIRAFYCIYHPSQAIQRICQEPNCSQPLLCMDCGLVHDKNHSNYISKPFEFFNNMAEQLTNIKKTYGFDFPIEFKDLIEDEENLTRQFISQSRILKEEIYKTMEKLKKEFNKFCDRKQVKLIRLVDYPEQSLKNNFIQFREKLQSAYKVNNRQSSLTLDDIISKVNRLKKSNDLETYINQLKNQISQPLKPIEFDKNEDIQKVNNELNMIKEKINFYLDQTKYLKIANKPPEDFKAKWFSKLNEFFDKEFLSEQLYSFTCQDDELNFMSNFDSDLKLDHQVLTEQTNNQKMVENIKKNEIISNLDPDINLGLPRKKKPKRPRGAFIQYMAAVKEHHLKSHPELPWRQVVSYSSKKWKLMSDIEKDPYIQLARQDRERYWNELRNYRREFNDEFEIENLSEDDDFNDNDSIKSFDDRKNLELGKRSYDKSGITLPLQKKNHVRDSQPSKELLKDFDLEILDLPEEHDLIKIKFGGKNKTVRE